jgi:pimeloyl-ACP methyl ester carboxylesterase
MRMEVLDAGHWVHAEQPGETLRVVKEFMEGIEG